MLGKNELKKTDIFKLCRSLDKQEAIKCLFFLTEFTNASKKCRILYDEICKLYKRKKYNWEKVNISLSDLNQKFFGKAEDNNFRKNSTKILNWFREQIGLLKS